MWWVKVRFLPRSVISFGRRGQRDRERKRGGGGSPECLSYKVVALMKSLQIDTLNTGAKKPYDTMTFWLHKRQLKFFHDCSTSCMYLCGTQKLAQETLPIAYFLCSLDSTLPFCFYGCLEPAVNIFLSVNLQRSPQRTSQIEHKKGEGQRQ